MERNLAVQERASFEIVRYANCWEDAAILVKALQIDSESNCLSIASAGDNTLAILAQSPAFVVAVDLSQAQLACLEIRQAAFKNLEYEEILKFLGFTDADDRVHTYRLIRKDLSTEARHYWDGNLKPLADGVIRFGKFENYFRFFRDYVLPLIHRRSKRESLLATKTMSERVEFYEKYWDNRRWRVLFNVFFSKRVMGKLGRDPEFFRYVEGSVADKILLRVKQALTDLPTDDNPYLRYIMKGQFQNVLPLYMQRENYLPIRENLHKLEIFRGPVELALQKYHCRFDAFNLSDIFEYMDDHLFRTIAAAIIEKANPGARLAYWNMLVERSVASLFPSEIRLLRERADELFQEDQAFFYQTFRVEERI